VITYLQRGEVYFGSNFWRFLSMGGDPLFLTYGESAHHGRLWGIKAFYLIGRRGKERGCSPTNAFKDIPSMT
jgi:hypothetical protein